MPLSGISRGRRESEELGYLGKYDSGGGWYGEPVLSHPLDMQLYGVTNVLLGLLKRLTSRHASGQIGCVCRKVPLASLDDHWIFHFQPACR
uniref:Uncharacterized protein n=1 Tax=mine drainage metagenome TaxID=410659 RepID=E6PD34_9ZZZZ